MYGPDDNNGQQSGGSTPPPMLDTPVGSIGSDGPGTPPDPSADSTATDTGAGNYMMGDNPPGMGTSDPINTVQPSADDNNGQQNDDNQINQVFNDPQADAGGSASDPDASSASHNDLIDLKQQALQQLTPLVDHLKQSPEDEFRTTMMMIQASDNQELLPKAFAAAQKITDDREKAQALLDVINEINYFTQQPAQ